ncbi:MAG: hypothetical protein WAZ19_07155 [Anaerolineae bacterium]
MSIRLYQFLALANALFWGMLGVLTIGSILLSRIGWPINLLMGNVFAAIGGFLYRRAYHWWRFYQTAPGDVQNSAHVKHFLHLDLIFLVGTGLIGGILLAAGISRVFGEGYAIFG